MVTQFAQDQRLKVDAGELIEQTRRGDLSAILKHYEEDLKKPVRSLLLGITFLHAISSLK